MKDLSISQEYLLCSLSEKGKLPVIGKEVPACILSSALIEMLINGSIQIDEKNMVRTTGELGEGQDYLKTFFDWIRGLEPMKLEKIAREYCLTLTDKRLNALVIEIGNSLADRGCAIIEKGGPLAGKPNFIPDSGEVDMVIQKIRAELLEGGAMADETVALVSLMEKSYRLKRYFSKYEARQLKTRLREIRLTPSNQLVKQTVEYVDTMIAAIIVITSVR